MCQAAVVARGLVEQIQAGEGVWLEAELGREAAEDQHAARVPVVGEGPEEGSVALDLGRVGPARCDVVEVVLGDAEEFGGVEAVVAVCRLDGAGGLVPEEGDASLQVVLPFLGQWHRENRLCESVQLLCLGQQCFAW